MSQIEMVRVGVVAAVIAAILLFDIYLVLRHFARVAGSGGEGSPGGKLDKLWVKLAALGLTLLLAGCGAYAYFIEPGRLSVERVTLTTDKLRSGDRFRIIFLADLHLEPGTRVMDAASLASTENPDVILLGGDYLNDDSRESKKLLSDFCAKLKARFGVYAVTGNWEPKGGLALPLVLEGVKPLHGEVQSFDAGGGSIAVLGLPCGDTRALKEFSEESKKYYTVVLHHTPDIIDAVREGGVDLMLAGHTHGGQVRLPWYGALVTLSKHDKRYEMGLYREGKTTLYVTRGLGMCGWYPRVRFLCAPEVTVIDVTGTGK